MYLDFDLVVQFQTVCSQLFTCLPIIKLTSMQLGATFLGYYGRFLCYVAYIVESFVVQ